MIENVRLSVCSCSAASYQSRDPIVLLLTLKIPHDLAERLFLLIWTKTRLDAQVLMRVGILND